MTTKGVAKLGTIWLRKTDGLGARLREIIVGTFLAKQLNLGLRIQWKTQEDWIRERNWQNHLDSNVIFDYRWSSVHLADVIGPHNPRVVKEWPIGNLQARRLQRTSSDIVLKKVPKRYAEIASFLTEDEVSAGLEDAFRSIGWSARVQESMAAGNATGNGNEIAIHLRQGDVVEGEYRYHGNWAKKAIPWPVAECIAGGFLEASVPVLYVGPSGVVRKAERGTSTNIGARESRTHPIDRMFFDIGILSKARAILMGSDCNFGLIAAWSTQRSIRDPINELRSFCHPSDILELALSEGSKFPLQDRAFAIQWILIHFGNLVAPTTRIELIMALERFDPGNPVYPLVLAANHLRQNEGRAAHLKACSSIAKFGELSDYQRSRFLNDLGFGDGWLLSLKEARALVSPSHSSFCIKTLAEWVSMSPRWKSRNRWLRAFSATSRF